MPKPKAFESKHYLLEVQLLRNKVPSFEHYPFSLPAVRNFTRLDLHPAVSVLIGENGTGKSTLVEAIAVAWGFNPEGGSKNFHFGTRASHSELNQYLRFVRSVRRPKDGFFLRAESFYNVGTEIERLDSEPSFGPPLKASYGGISLHEQSHGEAFFSLFIERFGGEGFYILDEPEAALSPQRQLAFLSRLHELVEGGSQFLIATHSPIIMAYPNAQIHLLVDDEIRPVAYTETDHYRITRQFLGNHEKMLHLLMAADPGPT